MNATKQYTFSPDYTVHPGEILAETLQARTISQSEFASRCELSEKHVSQIINGKASITSETALTFERVLAVRASLWMNLDSNHRLHIAREEEQTRLMSYVEWAYCFPLQALAKRGWIPSRCSKEVKIRALLEFFGVTSPGAWEKQYNRLVVAYRKSPAFTSSRESVASWLRIGELEAADINTDPFDKAKFRQVLDEILHLTQLEPVEFEPRMKQLCCEAGVALVFVPELPKTRLSGTTRWVSSEKALIIQSLRHRKDDHFWFTFFHEAAHVLLHGKRAVFIDEISMDTSDEEKEADTFAANHLIPQARYAAFANSDQPSKQNVQAFADELAIAPGILVGRLQHDNIIPFSRFNELKRTFVFAEEDNE